VDALVSSLLDEALEDHTAELFMGTDHEDAESVEFFAEDFDDSDACEDGLVVDLPLIAKHNDTPEQQFHPSTSCSVSATPNVFLKYVCRLLDGALSGKASAFDQPSTHNSLFENLVFTGRHCADARLSSANKVGIAKTERALPVDCLPRSPPLTARPAFKRPSGFFSKPLEQLAAVPMHNPASPSAGPQMQVPRPPAEPYAKRPQRRFFGAARVQKAIDRDSSLEVAKVLKAPASARLASAMELDLGEAEELEVVAKVVPEQEVRSPASSGSPGFLPPIVSFAGAAESVAGWQLGWSLTSKALEIGRGF